MVDLVVGVLHLMRQRVQKVLTLERLGHHALDVRQPAADVTGLGCWARIAPAVAIGQTIARNQGVCACGVGHADQRLSALGLAQLVKRVGRLDLAPVVDRLATDVTKQGVESAARQLALVLQVEVGVVCLDVGEAAPPFGLFNAAELFALDFGDDFGGLIGVLRRWGQLGQRRVHRLRQQLLTQPWGVGRATIVGHPLQKQTGVEVHTMRMQAAVGAAGGHVPAFGVAVGVLGTIGADDASPALAVGLGQQQTLL